MYGYTIRNGNGYMWMWKYKTSRKINRETYADKDFMKDLAAGLEARWSVEEPEQYTEGDDASKEYYTEMVNAEYEKVTPYLDKNLRVPLTAESNQLYQHDKTAKKKL